MIDEKEAPRNSHTLFPAESNISGTSSSHVLILNTFISNLERRNNEDKTKQGTNEPRPYITWSLDREVWFFASVAVRVTITSHILDGHASFQYETVRRPKTQQRSDGSKWHQHARDVPITPRYFVFGRQQRARAKKRIVVVRIYYSVSYEIQNDGALQGVPVYARRKRTRAPKRNTRHEADKTYILPGQVATGQAIL